MGWRIDHKKIHPSADSNAFWPVVVNGTSVLDTISLRQVDGTTGKENVIVLDPEQVEAIYELLREHKAI